MSWNPTEHYKSRTVAAEYDASRFSSVAGRVFNHWERRIIAKCFSGLPEGSALVDIPCGTGRLAETLLSCGYRVHGMDISGEMLKIARQRLHRFGTWFTSDVCDATKLTPPARTFDAALCARVLMHFPMDQQIAFLSGVAKLSHGSVVINHSLDSAYQRFRRAVKRFLGHQAPAGFPVSNSDIKLLLAGAGLREVRRYRLLPMISEAVYIVATKVP